MLAWRPDWASWKELWQRLSETPFWKETVAAHPWRTAAVLAAAVTAVCVAMSLKSRREDKILASDRRAIDARRACGYYRNKLRVPDIRLTTRDRKQFRKCDPLHDGLAPKEALRNMAWDWCYCRYVASLIDADAAAAMKKSAGAPRCVRREVKKLYREAAAGVPDLCRIWLAYVDPKGRERSEYRFTYRPEEILEAAGPETCNGVKALIGQEFECAACGKDPDDGDPYEWDNGTAKTICASCSVSKAASENIKAAMAGKSKTE